MSHTFSHNIRSHGAFPQLLKAAAHFTRGSFPFSDCCSCSIALLLDVANMQGAMSDVCNLVLRHHLQGPRQHRLIVNAFIEAGAEAMYDASLRQFCLSAQTSPACLSPAPDAAETATFLLSSTSTDILLRRLAMLPPTTNGSNRLQQLPSCWREVRLESSKDAADLQIAAFVALTWHKAKLHRTEQQQRRITNIRRRRIGCKPQFLPRACIVVTNDLCFWRGLSPLYPATFLRRVATNLDGIDQVVDDLLAAMEHTNLANVKRGEGIAPTTPEHCEF